MSGARSSKDPGAAFPAEASVDTCATMVDEGSAMVAKMACIQRRLKWILKFVHARRTTNPWHASLTEELELLEVQVDQLGARIVASQCTALESQEDVRALHIALAAAEMERQEALETVEFTKRMLPVKSPPPHLQQQAAMQDLAKAQQPTASGWPAVTPPPAKYPPKGPPQEVAGLWDRLDLHAGPPGLSPQIADVTPLMPRSAGLAGHAAASPAMECPVPLYEPLGTDPADEGEWL